MRRHIVEVDRRKKRTLPRQHTPLPRATRVPLGQVEVTVSDENPKGRAVPIFQAAAKDWVERGVSWNPGIDLWSLTNSQQEVAALPALVRAPAGFADLGTVGDSLLLSEETQSEATAFDARTLELIEI